MLCHIFTYRYDTDLSGGIDYMEFISKAMFEDPRANGRQREPPVSPHRTKTKPQSSAERPDFDDTELRNMQEAELRRVFNLVNRNSPTESVSLPELQLLLLTLLGYELPAKDVEGCVDELRSLAQRTGQRPIGPIGSSDISVPFDLFLHWWTNGNSSYLQSKPLRK